MAITRWDPFREVVALQNRVNSLFRACGHTVKASFRVTQAPPMSCFCEKKCCDAQAFFGRLAPISRARVRVPCRPCTRTSFAGPEHASSARTRVAVASGTCGGGPGLTHCETLRWLFVAEFSQNPAVRPVAASDFFEDPLPFGGVRARQIAESSRSRESLSGRAHRSVTPSGIPRKVPGGVRAPRPARCSRSRRRRRSDRSRKC